MLPAIRSRASRLRCLVAVLAVIAPLAFPGAASADNSSANAESIQYISTSVAPVSGSDMEYDNQAAATETTNGQTDLSVSFKDPLSFDSVITANNNANAAADNCQNCSAAAISVQTVIVAESNLAELTAQDVANAGSLNCTNCNTLAEAFQIVYAPLSTDTFGMALAYIGQLQRKLVALQLYHLSLAQIQSQSTADVKATMLELEEAAEADQQLTPSLGGFQPAELTSQQPVIDLLSAFHH
jgi:hypothetical protein